MQSFMRQKAGKESCEKCGGQGCWSCERKGFVLSCPHCMSQFNQTQDGDNFRCGECSTVYGGAGEIVDLVLPETRRERKAREIQEKVAREKKARGH